MLVAAKNGLTLTSRHEIASHFLQVTLRYTQTVNRVRGYPKSFLRSNRCAIGLTRKFVPVCSLMDDLATRFVALLPCIYRHANIIILKCIDDDKLSTYMHIEFFFECAAQEIRSGLLLDGRLGDSLRRCSTVSI